MAYTPEELHAHMERLEDKVDNLNASEKETGMNTWSDLKTRWTTSKPLKRRMV